MSVIIRLQNLPWSASSADIRRFFKGLTIPDGGVHIVGGDEGDAFIAFATDEDARQAMRLTGEPLNGTAVKLYLSSRSEMQTVINKARGVSAAPVQPQPTPQLPNLSQVQIPANLQGLNLSQLVTRPSQSQQAPVQENRHNMLQQQHAPVIQQGQAPPPSLPGQAPQPTAAQLAQIAQLLSSPQAVQLQSQLGLNLGGLLQHINTATPPPAQETPPPSAPLGAPHLFDYPNQSGSVPVDSGMESGSNFRQWNLPESQKMDLDRSSMESRDRSSTERRLYNDPGLREERGGSERMREERMDFSSRDDRFSMRDDRSFNDNQQIGDGRMEMTDRFPPDHNRFAPPPDHNRFVPPPDQGRFAPPPDQGRYAPPPDHNRFAPPPKQGRFAPPDRFPPDRGSMDNDRGLDFGRGRTDTFRERPDVDRRPPFPGGERGRGMLGDAPGRGGMLGDGPGDRGNRPMPGDGPGDRGNRPMPGDGPGDRGNRPMLGDGPGDRGNRPMPGDGPGDRGNRLMLGDGLPDRNRFDQSRPNRSPDSNGVRSRFDQEDAKPRRGWNVPEERTGNRFQGLFEKKEPEIPPDPEPLKVPSLMDQLVDAPVWGRNIPSTKNTEPAPTTGRCVILNNMPTDIAFREVKRFFSVEVPRHGLKFACDANNERTGIAYVRFATIADCQLALKENKIAQKDVRITIKSCSEQEFELATEAPEIDKIVTGDKPSPARKASKEKDDVARRQEQRSRSKDRDRRDRRGRDGGRRSRSRSPRRSRDNDRRDNDRRDNDRRDRDRGDRRDDRRDDRGDKRGRHDDDNTKRRHDDEKRAATKSDSKDAPKELCLAVKGLPPKLKIQDIIDFFKDLKLITNSVYIEYDAKGIAVGPAYMEFSDREDFKQALTYNKRLFLTRFVDVEPMARKEIESRVKEHKRSLTKGRSENKDSDKEARTEDAPTLESKKDSCHDDSFHGEVKSDDGPPAIDGPFIGDGDLGRPPPPKRESEEVGPPSDLPKELSSIIPDVPGDHENLRVSVGGLPWFTTAQEIEDWFGPSVRIVPGSMVLDEFQPGKKTPNRAFFTVESQEDIVRAVARHKEYMGKRFLTVWHWKHPGHKSESGTTVENRDGGDRQKKRTSRFEDLAPPPPPNQMMDAPVFDIPVDRFDGPLKRFSDGGPSEGARRNRFDGPGGPFDRESSLNRFDPSGPPPRSTGPVLGDGPLKRFDGPPNRFDGPPNRFDGPPDRFDGPPSRFDGPPSRFDGPPNRFDGPPDRFDGPPAGFDADTRARDNRDRPSRFDDGPRDRSSRFSSERDRPSRDDDGRDRPSRFDDRPSRFDESSRDRLPRSRFDDDSRDRSSRFEDGPRDRPPRFESGSRSRDRGDSRDRRERRDDDRRSPVERFSKEGGDRYRDAPGDGDGGMEFDRPMPMDFDRPPHNMNFNGPRGGPRDFPGPRGGPMDFNGPRGGPMDFDGPMPMDFDGQLGGPIMFDGPRGPRGPPNRFPHRGRGMGRGFPPMHDFRGARPDFFRPPGPGFRGPMPLPNFRPPFPGPRPDGGAHVPTPAFNPEDGGPLPPNTYQGDPNDIPESLQDPSLSIVKVSRLPYKVPASQIMSYFKDYNPIENSAHMRLSFEGMYTGDGMLAFENRADAERAVSETDGKIFGRKPIKVILFRRMGEKSGYQDS